MDKNLSQRYSHDRCRPRPRHAPLRNGHHQGQELSTQGPPRHGRTAHTDRGAQRRHHAATRPPKPLGPLVSAVLGASSACREHDPAGNTIRRRKLDLVPPFTDLTPVRIPFRFDGLPANPSGWRIVADPANRIAEIHEEHNMIALPGGAPRRGGPSPGPPRACSVSERNMPTWPFPGAAGRGNHASRAPFGSPQPICVPPPSPGNLRNSSASHTVMRGFRRASARWSAVPYPQLA